MSYYFGEEIIDFVQYGTSKELNEHKEGFPTLRLNEFELSFISNPAKFCNKIDTETYKSLELKKNDVLICRTNGNPKFVGKSAIVPIDYPFAYASYLFKIRPKNDMINSSTLVAYLNGTHGRVEIEKYAMVGNQANFSPAKFKEIRIPNFTNQFNNHIEKLTFLCFNVFTHSKSLYTQAEQLLLDELGLKNWQPSAENSNTKSFKESFSSTGRLDAEYYQPKYELLLTHLKQFDTKKLGLIVKIQKSIEPGSEAYQDKGIPFIRVSNLSKFGITDTEIHLNKEEYQSFTPKPKKDTILLTKDGSVGIAFKVENDLDVVTSSALLHLTVADDEFLPDYLTLVLNSIVVKLQAERDAGGSIIQHWKPSEIEQIVIPKLPISKQHLLAEKIQKSFKLKHQSEHLLEVAKHAVEIAIEQDEKAATQYIQQNTKEV